MRNQPLCRSEPCGSKRNTFVLHGKSVRAACDSMITLPAPSIGRFNCKTKLRLPAFSFTDQPTMCSPCTESTSPGPSSAIVISGSFPCKMRKSIMLNCRSKPLPKRTSQTSALEKNNAPSSTLRLVRQANEMFPSAGKKPRQLAASGIGTTGRCASNLTAVARPSSHIGTTTPAGNRASTTRQSPSCTTGTSKRSCSGISPSRSATKSYTNPSPTGRNCTCQPSPALASTKAAPPPNNSTAAPARRTMADALSVKEMLLPSAASLP